MAKAAIPLLPPHHAFFAQTMDVFTRTVQTVIPLTNKTDQVYTAVPILMTGTALEGTRSKGDASFGYTHVILCDPSITIIDGYRGDAGPEDTPPVQFQKLSDLVAIPTGATNNWLVKMVLQAKVPGLGERKIVLIDRLSVSDWTKLV